MAGEFIKYRNGKSAQIEAQYKKQGIKKTPNKDIKGNRYDEIPKQKHYKIQTDHLRNAKENRDDEFYTPRDYTDKVVNTFFNELKGKKVLCPCDSKHSNFVKSLQALNIEVYYSDCDFADYDNASLFGDKKRIELLRGIDIILTNPPFSKYREFYRIFRAKKIFAIAPLMLFTYTWAFPLWKNEILWKCLDGAKYFTDDKGKHLTAGNFLLTNFAKPKSIKKEQEKKKFFMHENEKYLYMQKYNKDFIIKNTEYNLAVPLTITLDNELDKIREKYIFSYQKTCVVDGKRAFVRILLTKKTKIKEVKK
jgi:hypothetical protein